jgi:hypothetical protein
LCIIEISAEGPLEKERFMRIADWFALAVRVGGIWLLVSGLGLLLDSSLFKLGYFNYLESSPGYFLICGLAQVLAGLYLVRGAPQLVEFAYPTEDEVELNGEANSD